MKIKFLTSLLMLVFSSLQANPTETSAEAKWVFDYVATIPDFPQKGIQFKWYAPLLKDPAAFKKAIKVFADRYKKSQVDVIAGLDSRGFIFGTALAYELDIPFVLVRKQGKLPGDVIALKYDLEYGIIPILENKALFKPRESRRNSTIVSCVVLV